MRRFFLAFVLVLVATLNSVAQTVTSTVLHSFNDVDGYSPSNLVQGANGGFYGTTLDGGNFGYGSAFVLSSSGSFMSLSNFDESDFGENPTAPIQGSDGNFYGTTAQGPTLGSGTVFQFTPSGILSNAFVFDGLAADGGNPSTRLTLGSDGNYYGTAVGPRPNIWGNIFRLTPTGSLTTIYSLQVATDGTNPTALVQATDGNFYGATQGGGADNNGTLFKIKPSGEFTTLYSFTGKADGAQPVSALIQGRDGYLYGTAKYGGTNPCLFSLGCGTVFKISTSGDFTILYDFTGGNDGFDPEAGLFAGSDGNIYGTAYFGGASEYGSVFEITSSGVFKTIYAFKSTEANNPDYDLIQGNDGNLYGPARAGGTSDMNGTIYQISFSPALPPPVQLSLSQSQITLGSSVTLSWKVLNAFSNTMRQCYAFVQNSAAGSGTWTGKQTGTYSIKTDLLSGASTITPTANGTYTYALTCGGQESGFATLIVGYNSATALSASPASLTVGQSATLSATVTGSQGLPTGSVTFSVSGVSLGSAKLNSSGVATLTASSNGISPGNYPITATYSGDSTYSSSSSKALTIDLAKATTSTALTASPTSVAPPGSVTLTATVTRSTSGGTGTPTGSVTFSTDGVKLATVKLNSKGVAAITASSTGYPAGEYPVIATYAGDAFDSGSTSQSVTVTVK